MSLKYNQKLGASVEKVSELKDPVKYTFLGSQFAIFEGQSINLARKARPKSKPRSGVGWRAESPVTLTYFY